MNDRAIADYDGALVKEYSTLDEKWTKDKFFYQESESKVFILLLNVIYTSSPQGEFVFYKVE